MLYRDECAKLECSRSVLQLSELEVLSFDLDFASDSGLGQRDGG